MSDQNDILVAEMIVNTGGLVEAVVLVGIETQDLFGNLSRGWRHSGKVEEAVEAQRVAVVRHDGQRLDLVRFD